MDSKQPPQLPPEISDDDWERTPKSVKNYIEELQRSLAQQEQKQDDLATEIQSLREQLGTTSSN